MSSRSLAWLYLSVNYLKAAVICLPPQVIPCIWTGYPPPSSVMRGVMLLLYLIIGLIAVTANSLVIILWVRSVASSVIELEPKVRENFSTTRAFSWLKAPTRTFTFKTLLRHYAKPVQ